MFKEMEEAFKEQTLSLIETINIEGAQKSQNLPEEKKEILLSNSPEKTEVKNKEEKNVGRNDPCPCGSGKKYKQCHGK